MGRNLPLWPSEKSYWINLPFSRNSGNPERKRPDQEGILCKIACESRERTIYFASNLFTKTPIIAVYDREFLCSRVTLVHHSSDRPCSLAGGGLTFGDHEFTSITQLQPTNLQDSLQIWA